MRKSLYLAIGLVVALTLSGTLAYALSQEGHNNGFTPVTQEESSEIAEEYLRNSPTFVFDGIEDTLRLVETHAMFCPYCWGFEFEFQCRHAGYGDRSGQAVAEVITPHTAMILVQEGEVVGATMDGVWDMMNQQEIIPSASGGAIAEATIVEVGSSFILYLASNHTTGYAWQAQFDDELLELVETNSEPSSQAIGAGGVESFEFRALKKGDTEITMVYKRSWEEGCLQKVIFSVHITEAEG